MTNTDQRFEDYRQKTRSFLQQRLACFGETDRAIWGESGNHRRNLQALLAIGDLTNKSILDVGCGFGDLLDHLEGTGISFYLGVDISSEAIEIARRRHPDHKFEHRDIHLNPFPPSSFDFVFASGIFSLSYAFWEEYVGATMSLLFGFCRKGTAASFTERLIGTDGLTAHSCSSNVLHLLSNLTERIGIHHGYVDGDYRAYLYK